MSKEKIKTILFDLDGTLLPLDQDEFVKTYLELLVKRMAQHGYDPQRLTKAIWKGTGAMVYNTSGKSNETVFWKHFCAIFGEDARDDEPLFEAFYKEDFEKARAVCGYNPAVPETIAALKGMGFPLVLATNPVFPAIATESRMRWAGVSPSDFVLYTTYENSFCAKPNPQYYSQIVKQLHIRPEECLMVGNDVTDDAAAEKIGMRVFLLTDCLINRENRDISAYPQGSFSELMRFIEEER